MCQNRHPSVQAHDDARWMIGAFCVSLCLVFLATPALAHNVTIFAQVKGNTVFTESKLGGKPAKNASIVIKDMEGKQLLEGKTDEQGAFSFKTLPNRKGLKVVVNASMGHQAEWIISAEELSGTVDVSESGPAQGSTDMAALGPQVGDVIVGIGCIFGLVAVALYFSRRKNRKAE
jgi:hypothetical protein